MTAIEIINQIEADKKERHIAPHHATLLEIEARATDMTILQIRTELNQLWVSKKIKVGNTINGKYINII